MFQSGQLKKKYIYKEKEKVFFFCKALRLIDYHITFETFIRFFDFLLSKCF
jgi:hypothetical protein